jgi:hypothetical protein
VKSEKPAETVLNPEPTPETAPASSGIADLGTSPEASNESPTIPVNTYVEKITRANSSKTQSSSKPALSTPALSSASSTPLSASTPVTPQNTPLQTPAMETASPVKKKTNRFGLLGWALLAVIVAGGGWILWSRKNSGSGPDQPGAPLGGLSPVSGFTGFQGEKESLSGEKTSFWFKKIF